MDDHEVRDNWEPSLDAHRNAARFGQLRAARAAFLREQRPAQPRAALWYATRLGPHGLFVGDTRTRRTARSPLAPEAACILGRRQRAALLTFLGADDPGRFKFVATPSLFLPRRLATCDSEAQGCAGSIESDAWDGYPGSLHAVLGCIAEHKVENVVFLSGDEHRGMVTTIRLHCEGWPPDTTLTVLSIHAPALYAPYPFANSTPDAFAHDERHAFVSAGGSRVTCDISTWFPDWGTASAPSIYRPPARRRSACATTRRTARTSASGRPPCPRPDRRGRSRRGSRRPASPAAPACAAGAGPLGRPGAAATARCRR